MSTAPKSRSGVSVGLGRTRSRSSMYVFVNLLYVLVVGLPETREPGASRVCYDAGPDAQHT